MFAMAKAVESVAPVVQTSFFKRSFYIHTITSSFLHLFSYFVPLKCWGGMEWCFLGLEKICKHRGSENIFQLFSLK